MAQAASLWVKLGITSKEFDDGLKRAENQMKRFGDRLSNLGSRLTVGFSVPLALASGAAIKFGMDAVESENLFTVSMGKMVDSARAWSEDLRKNLGLNAYEVRKNIGTFNVMLTSMGLSEQAAYDMAKGLTQLAYDMASFYNLKPEEAFLKLQSGISGEIEPLKRLGIVVNETTIKTWALNNGIIKQGQELSEAQKVAARYAVIMEQTSKAQGDLARTIDSPANKLRILQQQFQQIATDLGMALLPAFTSFLTVIKPLVQIVQSLAEWFSNLNPTIQNLIAGMVAFNIALGPVTLGLGKIAGAFSAIPGLIKTLITDLPRLTTAFGPYLAGGAIVAGLAIIVDFFSKMAENARIAKLEIANISTLSDLTKKEQQIKSEIERLQNKKAAQYSAEKTQGGWLAGGFASWTDEDSEKLDALNKQLKEVEKQRQKLLQPATTTPTSTEITFPKIDFSTIPGLETGKKEETLEDILERRKKQGVENIKEYIEMLNEETAASYNQNTKAAEEWAEKVRGIVVDAAQGMEQSLSNGFFDIVKGDFDNLGDYFQNFLDSILRSWTDTMAQMMTKNIMSGEFGIWLKGLFKPKAMGGLVTAGQTYLVGERGPELFTPSSSGTITPNHALGSNITVQVVNPPGIPLKAKTTQPQFDGKQYVIGVVLEAFNNNTGGFRDALGAVK